ncbi:MAG: bifunctional folylpolyglutamate synthase/dihydrofolate synthase [Planctomycetes bacterium]|nr:bifunctional folylpolyglutamate synthase/dihydrofolate synthase [Planctomycetota bacterium]
MVPGRLRTLADVERLLRTTTNYEEKMPRDASTRPFDLARMEALLDAVGRPERGPVTAHVTGSKGKGSTCRMLDAVLRAAGRGPVGLYVSPHLESLAERVSVDGRPVSGAALARATEALRPALRAAEGTERFPTFFEVLTAAAHVAFRAAGCRSVVLEVGLGGRLDATNVCTPSVTAVTTVELEHVKLLGDTVEKIAAEKAGILKPGVPCVTAVPATSGALAVVEARARAVGAPLDRVGREVTLSDVVAGPGPRLALTVAGPDSAPPLRVEVPVAGEHQAGNAAVAVAMARRLGVGDDAVRAGLARVTLPARMEPVLARPTVVIDGAHTVASAQAARRALATCFAFRRLHLVVGALEEKDVRGILAPLLDGAASAVAVTVESPRALAADALAALVREGAPGATVGTAPDAATALATALARADADDLVLVTGSLYLAGAARAAARRLAGFLPTDGRPSGRRA